MSDTVKDDLIEIMLAHFKPSEHGGSWRLNPGAAAEDILRKYRLTDPGAPKKSPCADGHNFIVSHPPAGQWGYTFMYCTRCGGSPVTTTSTTTTLKKD